MKTRLSIVMEYSKGRNFEEAVTNLFKDGLMNGNYILTTTIDRELSRSVVKSVYFDILNEALVKYIVVENYDEEYDEWYVDYTEGIEILPCQL